MRKINAILVLASCLLLSFGLFACASENDQSISDEIQPADVQQADTLPDESYCASENDQSISDEIQPADVQQTDTLPDESYGDEEHSQKSGTTEPIILDNETFMEMCISPDKFHTIDALHHVLSGKGGEMSQYQVMQTQPVTYYYVPDFAYEGYTLHHTLLTTDVIQYYYVRENQIDNDIYQLDGHDMIIMTVTLHPISSDSPDSPEELLANPGNFVQKSADLYYSSKYRKVASYETGHYVDLRVPEYMNDYDTILSLCKVRKVTINPDAVTE